MNESIVRSTKGVCLVICLWHRSLSQEEIKRFSFGRDPAELNGDDDDGQLRTFTEVEVCEKTSSYMISTIRQPNTSPSLSFAAWNKKNNHSFCSSGNNNNNNGGGGGGAFRRASLAVMASAGNDENAVFSFFFFLSSLILYWRDKWSVRRLFETRQGIYVYSLPPLS